MASAWQRTPIEVDPVLNISKVSMVICTRNEGQYIRSTIDAILRTTFTGKVEIIVIDDGSTDGSTDFLISPKYRNVSFIRHKNLGVAGARHLGASIASGDVLLFLDAHLRVNRDWLEGLLFPLRDPNIHAVCPSIRNITVTNEEISTFYGGIWDQWFIWQPIGTKPIGISEVPLSPGGATAIRKTVYNDIGGHLQQFRGWGYEDQEFSLRLWVSGYRVVVQPRVKITHIQRRKQYNIDLRDLRRNLALLSFLHMDPEHLEKLKYGWRNDDLYHLRLTEITQDEECIHLKAGIDKNRKHSFEWFLEKFNIAF